ncbi:MAG: hypothetical protein LBD18_06705 [Treponema sp.]|nr:hypothetical protein [Treponema sp.]
MALQTPKFYLAGSKRARKKPQFEQALRVFLTERNAKWNGSCLSCGKESLL